MAVVTTVTVDYVANTANYVANINTAAAVTQRFADVSAKGFAIAQRAMVSAFTAGTQEAIKFTDAVNAATAAAQKFKAEGVLAPSGKGRPIAPSMPQAPQAPRTPLAPQAPRTPLAPQAQSTVPSLAPATASVPAYVQGMKAAAAATSRFTSQSTNGFTILKGAIATALGTGAYQAVMKTIGSVKNFAKESFNAAARVEELDISMRAIGKSTGKGYKEIKAAAKAIKDMGIESASASQMAIQFAQNNLDLASASKVARVAQDLAVVAGLNSTDTMNRLVQGILRGETELLKSAGIAKSAGQAYAEFAAENNRSTASLTPLEKQTAVTNMILAEGAKVAGTYEASMNSAGKVMRSFKRITNDIQVSLGSVMLQGLGPIIKAIYDLYKGFSKSIGEGGAFRGVLDTLAKTFGELTSPIVDLIKQIAAMFSDKKLMKEFGEKLQGIIDLMLLLSPLVIAAVASFVMFRVVTQVLDGTKQALAGLTKMQKAFNVSVLANPYVFIAALIIGAVVAIALALKYFYDKSVAVQNAVTLLLGTLKIIGAYLVNTLLKAWKAVTGQTDNALESSKSLSENLSDFVTGVIPYVVTFVKGLTVAFRVVATVVVLVVKWFTILITLMKMLYGTIAAAFIKAWELIVEKFNMIMDKIGPMGDTFQNAGSAIYEFFKNLGPNIVSIFNSAVRGFEPFVNKIIDGVNLLIEAYNKINIIGDDVRRLDPFTLDMGTADYSEQHKANAEALMAATNQDRKDYTAAQKKKEEEEEEEEDRGGGGGNDKADRLAKKLEALKEKFEALKTSLLAAAGAYKEIVAATAERFGEKSNIINAFGSGGDIGSAISQYDQLSASVDNYFESMKAAAEVSDKTAGAVAGLNGRQVAVNKFLKESTQKAVDLYRIRKDIIERQTKNEEEYAKSQSDINSKYDLLDKQAQAALDAIEQKYAKMIPVLEDALTAATAAYDKENNTLQDLISKRDTFLGMIGSSFTAFVNSLTLDEGTNFKSALTARLTSIKEFTANLKILMEKGLDPSLIQDFISAGVSGAGAIAAQLVANPADIAVINDLQKELAEQVASFTETASAQWFDAGIAQAQAVVAPLLAAAVSAQAALDLANTSRASELVAAENHARVLRENREKELAAAYETYIENDKRLKEELKKNEEEIEAHAKVIQDYFTALQLTLPVEMRTTGNEAIKGLIAGLKDEEFVKELKEAARKLAKGVRDELVIYLRIKSPSKLTEDIGRQIAQGLVDGMLASEGIIRDAATSLAVAATPPIGVIGVDGATMPLIAAAAATGAQGNVMIAEGAVQMTFTGSMDNASREQIQAAVDEGLLRLAREIRRTM